MAITVRVQAEDFDAAAEVAALSAGRTDIGAVSSFLGLCRDEGGSLAALELEHYPGMAQKQIEAIAVEAVQRFQLFGLTVIHRFGRVAPGEQIVLVAASASSRVGAFRATEFVMDFLKTDAPFWKKEHLVSGKSGDWVEAKADDAKRRKAWRST
ncbi:molybdenum cofactor biosynthesis protein MoaE [Limoniibacter endophyticus]|uniref:Molybdopterin synthase catalytic subunit n=1 Tax=Limoniibacter endophyticus TaxID=1565040 RepID=A0A8J3DGB6_9HYPH|nr:molybdenum cofactor biosynthesis protein MoaE [Limoniibacter endophyticus]GHC68721.1 molybdenum cofactor biosynthesis protein MoaE [Limoniibacter endophyticus]